MSILSEPFYACKCDNCGRIEENYDGISFWADKETAHDNAMESGWEEVDGRDICELCWSMDDDDKIIINTSRTKVESPSPNKD